MPKTSESPAETRNRSPASASALSACSIRMDTARGPGAPLRKVLRQAFGGDLVARIGGEDLGDQVRVLRVLHRLHREPELDGLVIALAHEERSLEALVARVLPRGDPLLDVVAAGFGDGLGQPLQPLIGLAVEHVRVSAVELVEALDEVAVLRRVDGEGIARA